MNSSTVLRVETKKEENIIFISGAHKSGAHKKRRYGIELCILKHKEGIDLMQANIELPGLEVSVINMMSRELVMHSYIEQIKKNYDYILIVYLSAYFSYFRSCHSYRIHSFP